MKSSAFSSLDYTIALIDQQFQKKDYKKACNFILQGIKNFPDHPNLLDRFFIVDPRWCLLISGNDMHLARPEENDLPFLQQCFANKEFMAQFLPMGRRDQSVESMRLALRQNEFPVARSRAVHWIIKKNQRADQPKESLVENSKPIGLASLVDIQIAHRRAEFLMGIPDQADRKQAAAVIATLLIFDFAFNLIGLHKLTAKVIANNQHSQKSTISIGFKQEGFFHEHLRDPKSRLWLDCYENGLIIKDFRQSELIARLSERLLGRDITLKI